MSRQGPFSPAALFDAAVDPDREHELEQEGLEILARPGMRLPENLPPDVVAIRRAFGEGRLAVVEAVLRVDGRSPLEAAGITCEGYADGVFAEVYRPWGPSRALRITDSGRIVQHDTVLLQPLSKVRPGAAPIFEDESVYESDAEEDPPAPFATPAAELAFILDPQRSTLERLPASQRDRFLTFAWDSADFPGGPTGPNEGRADQMFAALTRLRAERRANSGPHAAVTRAEFDAAMQARISAALATIPDTRGLKLHREAAEAFVRMRTAAAADGVTLSINNSYRTPARAQANAAKAGNAAAVASFSSHTLGLAIDFNMSHGTQRFSETSTRPFQNLVDMYKSPVHKWIFLRGQPFGWFPYSREPWHWEYNPDGFRARLRQAQPAASEPGTAAAAAAAASAAGAALAAGASAVAGAVGAAAAAVAAAVSPEDEFVYETDAEDDPPAAPFADAAAELAFIVDPQRSTLERLPAAQRDRFLRFAWHTADFPGGPPGPNEMRADVMFAALTRLRPERRANSGPQAAVTRIEFDAAMQARITAALTPIPGASGQQLHREAADAFVRMRTAAAADGVTLSINNSHRPATRAQAAAARAGNPAAVASFSSHTLGLAIDFNMSHGTLRFSEVTTRPFQNVVDMYKSPVHKWMFLRAQSFGWFPYRREPWHWEYNPDGFRARLRQSQPTPPTQPPQPTQPAPSPQTGAAPPLEPAPLPGSTGPAAASASSLEYAAESITDPIVPPRPPLAITAAVGRGGRNNAADVRAVQDRLVELRALDPADAATEQPSAAGVVEETALTRTIAAIEAFQRLHGITAGATVGVQGATRTELDRVIPPPAVTEFAAVTTERSTVQETVSRGLTITGPVGAAATGNAPDDVRAVQRRLVELRALAASHGETPAPGATGPVPQARLRATIAALRSFQSGVRFWLSRGTITGAVTSGVVAPADATLSLLQRINAYTMRMGGTEIKFHDHVTGSVVVSGAGVAFSGTASPSALPVADFVGQGLLPLQAAALKLVSTFEGNFDAINTYDRALVSAGFIQFAGSRGLPPYLALLKVRQPARFRDLLQRLGIDIEFSVSQGVITGARVVVLDPAGSRVLRAAAAEAAIRDDKKLTTALILSGRDRDVQLVQIEAAIRNYVMPALRASVSWGTGAANAPLGELLRSAKGMAALFDRTIQEGLGGSKRRFERIIQRLVAVPPAAAGRPQAAPATRAEVQSREGDVLAELERDLQAGADLTARIANARTSLETLIAATRAAGATVAGILAHAALADARRAVGEARTALAGIVNVSPAAGTSVDGTITSMTAALTAEQSRLAFAPPPAAVTELAAAFTASRAALASVSGPVSSAAIFLGRVQRIRRSTLDSGLAEAA